MSARPPRVRIDRCVCKQRDFAELLLLAQVKGWDLDDLAAATGCGTRCGLCRPYLGEMLRSGTTLFDRILTEG